MRIVLQRVSEARVEVNQEIIGSIKKGFLLLVGVELNDNVEDIEWLCKKIVNMRIFNDLDDKMNLSLLDVNGEILSISQFTLHANIKKGNRPSFIKAAKSDLANEMYNCLNAQLSELIGKEIKTGRFGADMKVSLINDGPVTILLDSKYKQ